jgi:hypothetical protein
VMTTRVLDHICGAAYAVIMLAALVSALVLAGGCGDNTPPLYRDALADLEAESRAYAERCGLEPWKVNDYERIMCDITEICNATPHGCDWEQGPLVACDVERAPSDWDFYACADALAELACADFINLPASCRVLIPWERERS